MPTINQIKALHAARREAKLNELEAGTVLRNIGGVDSATQLDNAAFEEVMAFLEESGATGHPAGPTYWRNKLRRRYGGFAGERMVHKIGELAAQTDYDLAGLCRRFSGDRTPHPSKLTPREAWQLVEMLKASAERAVARPANAPLRS